MPAPSIHHDRQELGTFPHTCFTSNLLVGTLLACLCVPHDLCSPVSASASLTTRPAMRAQRLSLAQSESTAACLHVTSLLAESASPSTPRLRTRSAARPSPDAVFSSAVLLHYYLEVHRRHHPVAAASRIQSGRVAAALSGPHCAPLPLQDRRLRIAPCPRGAGSEPRRRGAAEHRDHETQQATRPGPCTPPTRPGPAGWAGRRASPQDPRRAAASSGRPADGADRRAGGGGGGRGRERRLCPVGRHWLIAAMKQSWMGPT